MNQKTIYLLLLALLTLPCFAGSKYESKISSLAGEKWWGGMVALGSKMPFEGDLRLFDLSAENLNNQNVPLLLSSEGRYIWGDKPFSFKVENGELRLYSDYEKMEPVLAGRTLRDAYMAASTKYFPPSGQLPDPLFFSMPQYNTWIELMYNQNQEDILKYADNVLENKFPVGVFMVDDNWQKYYGNFDFKPERFPDPKGMIDRLHRQGFKIMFWICPFVSPDSPEFRELQQKGYLIKKKGTNAAAIIPWWNGYSACYDLSNPAAAEHLKQQLRGMQEKYGVDGILLVSPYYNKATQKGLYRHFKTVADSVKVPAILYNVPSRTGCNILPETVVKLCKDVENIVGVKEASGNISQIAHLAAIGQGVVDIYSGNDDQIVPILSLGGIGVISVLSNVAPTQTHEICQKFFDGDVAGSRQMQLDAMDLCNALFCEVNPIPVKTALNMMGMGAGAFRMPLCEMDEANAKRLEKALKDYGIL